jgi:hypothetical protein
MCICLNFVLIDDYVFVYLFLMIQNGYAYDIVIYQFERNIIRSGLCNIALHAEIEYKRNNDLLYSLEMFIKSV